MGLDRRWATEMNFAQPAGRPGRRRRWAGARVRRNSFRHASGQAMGDRNEFRSTGRAAGSGQAMGDRNECRSTGRVAGAGQAMGRRESSPKFISAWVWTGDGQAQEFADIHFGMGLDRRWVTEMNFGQRAGRRGLGRRWAGARVRRNSFRHGSAQAMGDRNEFRSTGRAAGSGQAMGRRKSSPTFISAGVWIGDGRPK